MTSVSTHSQTGPQSGYMTGAVSTVRQDYSRGTGLQSGYRTSVNTHSQTGPQSGYMTRAVSTQSDRTTVWVHDKGWHIINTARARQDHSPKSVVYKYVPSSE